MDRFHTTRNNSWILIWVFGTGILLLSLLIGACASSSTRTAPPTSTPQAEEFVLQFFDSWNKAVISGELDETLDYFSEDATLESVGYYHLLSTGKDEIRTALEYWIGSGYVHLLDEYEFSNDEEAMYWDLEFGGDNNFCHGKVVVRGQEIVYLGFSTC